MKTSPSNHTKNLVASSVLTLATLAGSVSAETVVILSEDWQTAGMTTGYISDATNAPLTGFAGFGLNNTNPTMLIAPSGGNVLRDQGGFGGTYGSATNVGNAVRVRSSNGAMLNETALQLVTLGATAVTFSFDLKQNTANYYQVVEFSNNIGFLTTGDTLGITNTVVLLDTIFTPTGGTVSLWEAKSYTLTGGVGVTFTDDCYFRIRKIYPNNPSTGNGGSNPTSHTYDNLLISAEVPATVSTFQLIITPNGANFDFSWNSQAGKVYDLVTSTDLVTPIVTWPVYDPDGAGGNAPLGDIPATGTTTTLTAVAGDGPTRFFSIVEKDAPPLFSEDFEADDGGFTTTGTPNDWAWGTPNSDNNATPSLIVTTGNGGSTKCWGTNLGTGGMPSGNINTAANSILRSPGINLTGITGATVSFAAALDASAGDAVQVLVREVGTDALLDTLTPFTVPVTATWASVGPLALTAADNKNIYLEFRYQGADAAYIGLYVDDVTVTQ